MHVYSRYPIDFWSGWMREDEYLQSLVREHHSSGGLATAIRGYEDFRDEGFQMARKIGWEGDIRQGPFIAGLPTYDGDGLIMIAWKQDNNGETFILSPIQLPWLET